MHVILGGAHNGKRAYVEREILKFKQRDTVFFEGIIPDSSYENAGKVLVISEFEKIIAPFLNQPEQIIAQEIFEQIEHLAQNNLLYCICTDTSRGIVPIEKEARQLRDTCGRLYQLLCAHADAVTRVWYGIPQQLKGDSYGEK
ncbi:bifunctional adenosylcobinamide kinase/adenosylcobinamide-phosphate guanylyltransferase [Solibacillus daqui]|uniref:bifunctional adenosylcobinamide kinase/adenosylcobinamide-phosphate guanylyltransferase n=1 Tax=Solibacillus daqui TaxID=2912187 RepID=UPI002365E144|nr:bifunctional adenosylcobinamide kinase/adenosylcobinamide-phosphate guanylyltransferase [Solibacillus daqui]